MAWEFLRKFELNLITEFFNIINTPKPHSLSVESPPFRARDDVNEK
jgi:hypothetical protein